MNISSIKLDRLQPHPKNPRLVLREDVISGIVAGLSGGFHPAHALQVWPSGDVFTILSGHHRAEGAKRAGLDEVPCWIRDDLTEDEAFMFLVTDNNQGELSPLEIGLHALEYVEKSTGGRGVSGEGLAVYASAIGKSAARITQVRQAAEVHKLLSQLNSFASDQLSALIGKAEHLTSIHKSPSSLWPILVSALLAKEWSVKDTKHFVGKVLEFEVPEMWQAVFLPLPMIISRYLERLEFSPKTVSKLIETAESIESRVETYKTNTSEIIAEFRQWLADHAGAESWDVRKIVEYGREIQARAEAAEREDQERFVFGDWREHIDKLADGSVSLILTDPPYGMGYQSDYRLNREKERKHETISNDATTENAAAEITECLTSLYPKLKESAHVFSFCHWSNEADIRAAVEAAGYKVRGSLIWVKNNTGMGDPNTTFAPKHERIIHAVKGSPVLFSRTADVLLADRCNSDRHPTEKPVDLLKQLIEVTTTKDEIVVDPFAGVASTLVAAKELGRAFFGCEINENYFGAGNNRL